jgi:hypothetical protein
MARCLRHRYSSPGVRTGFVLSVAILLFAAVAGFALSPARAAETPAPLSAGCTELNRATYDVQTTGTFAGTFAFLAGERIVLTAGAPATGAPTGVQFELSFTAVQSASYPGTLTYVVPADGTMTVSWTALGGDPTWAVSCQEPGSDPAPTPTPEPTATSVPTASACVPRGNENAERASQNGKEHSCLDQAKASKQDKGGKHSK